MFLSFRFVKYLSLSGSVHMLKIMKDAYYKEVKLLFTFATFLRMAYNVAQWRIQER